MKNKKQISAKLSALFLFSLLILNTEISLARTVVSLNPETLQVNTEESFDLGLFIDFGTDKTKSGTIDIAFDSDFVLFDSFEFDPGFNNRALGLDIIDQQTSELVSVGFGDFSDLEGAFKVGTISFMATSTPGTTSLSLSGSPKWGGFKDITLESANAQLEVQAVPLPSAAWFLGSSLIGLIGFNRNKANSRS